MPTDNCMRKLQPCYNLRMLVTQHKKKVDAVFRPLAAWLAEAGVSPDTITLATPVLATAICWWLTRSRDIVPFCFLILAVGVMDGLDGAVARVSGKTTKFGSYLDAMCDRYFETIVSLTVAWVTGYWFLCMAALAASLTISYAKARAALEVDVTNTEWPDLMERSERATVFLGGLLLGEVLPWYPLGHDLFWWAMVALVVLNCATVVQRVLRARRLILSRTK